MASLAINLNVSTKLLKSILKYMKNAKAVIPKIKIQDAIKQIIDTSKEEYIVGKKKNRGEGNRIAEKDRREKDRKSFYQVSSLVKASP